MWDSGRILKTSAQLGAWKALCVKEEHYWVSAAISQNALHTQLLCTSSTIFSAWKIRACEKQSHQSWRAWRSSPACVIFFDLQYFQKLLNGCWKFNGGDNQFWLGIPHRLICGHCLLGMNIANTQRQPFLCTSSKFNEENKSRSAADALGQKPENHSSFSFPPPPKKCTFGLAVSGLEMLKQD